MNNIKCLKDNLVDINIIREELDKLNIDFKQRIYYENNVLPLLNTLYLLSLSVEGLSNTAQNLANINVAKLSELKDVLDNVYDLNDISEDVLKNLKKKIEKMIELGNCDNK